MHHLTSIKIAVGILVITCVIVSITFSRCTGDIIPAPDLKFKYSITQITGLLTRRILNFLQSESKQYDILNPGHRLGFILLGSRVDVIIPNKNIQQILVKPGDHIEAMENLVIVK